MTTFLAYMRREALTYQVVAPLALIYAWTGANFKGYTMKVPHPFPNHYKPISDHSGIGHGPCLGRLEYWQHNRAPDLPG